MKEHEPLPAWVAEEQRERLRMEKVMANLEYLAKRYVLDTDELGEIAKAERLMREKVKKELSVT